ncbi:MAG TPA: TfoX/Sxy family protein [Acidimicrobiales bacterium]|jgi:TfoX/Sxy family transcriptional regulator of competence genes|nr:TfoX/Sxy family protein [Acidimicrobiales bacterium]
MGVVETEERFAAVVRELADRPGVELPEPARRRFGSDALKVNGSIFAMVTGGSLVVKLPRHRVDALISDGTGAPFDSGKGTPMKEWVRVVTDDQATWLSLAREALDFVGRGAGGR